MAYLGKEKQQSNAGARLKPLLNSNWWSSLNRSGGGVMDMITGVLDKDGDGDVMDDLMGRKGNY